MNHIFLEKVIVLQTVWLNWTQKVGCVSKFMTESTQVALEILIQDKIKRAIDQMNLM